MEFAGTNVHGAFDTQICTVEHNTLLNESLVAKDAIVVDNVNDSTVGAVGIDIFNVSVTFISDAFHDKGINVLDGNNTNESLNGELSDRGLNAGSPIVPKLGPKPDVTGFVPLSHD